MKTLFMLLFALLCFDVALAQTTTTLVVVPTPTPAVLAFLQKIDSQIPQSISTVAVLITTGVIELLMRLVPTVQPRSLLTLASAILVSVASILSKSSGIIDKILQNLKKPETETVTEEKK